MNDHLDDTLRAIGNEYADKISPSSRNYVEVDIGQKAKSMGFADIERTYRHVLAVVPIKQADKGMKVRIDGRTFVNYGQLESGVAIPGYVVNASNLPHKTFIPNDSMILTFA